MNILYSGHIGHKAGGMATSTYYSLIGLKQKGIDVSIIQYPLSNNDTLIGNEINIYYASRPLERKTLFSPKLKNEIVDLGSFDIYHAQGIWQWPTYVLASVAKKNNRPYIISPRGMLYPQDINKSNRWIKRLYLKFKLLEILNKATCIHVTCMEEMKYCRAAGVQVPIGVIPNSVEIKENNFHKTDSTFRVGYLGRLSPRKNVESLIYAFSILGKMTENAELIIIGDGDADYISFLHNEVKRLGLKNIKFAGFLGGESKDKALASCTVLAMPSEFENFGNVIVEGLAHRIPCIATTGSPWKELNTRNCGWWIPCTQNSITTAIASAINTSKKELDRMGNNGRLLVKERYSIEVISEQLLSLYKWVLGNGCRPDYVY